MMHIGRVRPGTVLRIPFTSNAAATGAPSAVTNYAVGDIQVYKDGNTTARASTSGFTATTSFNSLVGVNYATIDLADNTTAGFYSAGSDFTVVIGDITIDSQTVRFPLATFRIGFDGEIHSTSIATLSSQTSFTLTTASADNSAYVGCAIYVQAIGSAIQSCVGLISAYTGSTKTVTLASSPGIFTMAAGDNVFIFPPSGNVLGSVAGSVASVTGAVGSVTSGVNAIQFAGQTITAASGVTLPASVASTTNITAGTITTVTNLTNAPTAGDLTATMKTSVKTQVTDGINVDTYTEQGQGNPPATATFRQMLQWLYMAWRNKSTQTSSQYSLYADDTTTLIVKSSAADDGTTLTIGEKATGP